MKKNQNAITLISLIITILLLLILVAVVINFAIGDNGIFKLAENASDKYGYEAKKEENMLDDIYAYISGNRDTITLTNEQLQQIISSVNPTGTIISYMGNNVPTGYLSCDGTTYNINDYPTLAKQIETEFGASNHFGGDGQTTFAVPNLQGEFLRGTGTNTHSNQGNGASVGEHQNATQHIYIFNNENLDFSYPKNTMISGADSVIGSIRHTWNYDSDPNGATTAQYYTSRPTNTSVLYCIKY